MQLVVDVNLSAQWVSYLSQHGHSSSHWSEIGSTHDDDETILQWAAANDHAVLTNDLDFGTLLAFSDRRRPSVILLRDPKLLPRQIGDEVCRVIAGLNDELLHGCIVVINRGKARIRMLPLR